MSQFTQILKIEHEKCSNESQNEAKQSLHSGQFMTSRIDDNEVKSR